MRYVQFGCHPLTAQLALGNPITTAFHGNVRNLVEDNGWPNVDMRIALGLGPLEPKDNQAMVHRTGVSLKF